MHHVLLRTDTQESFHKLHISMTEIFAVTTIKNNNAFKKDTCLLLALDYVEHPPFKRL